jgi:hypothetical protein
MKNIFKGIPVYRIILFGSILVCLINLAIFNSLIGAVILLVACAAISAPMDMIVRSVVEDTVDYFRTSHDNYPKGMKGDKYEENKLRNKKSQGTVVHSRKENSWRTGR